MVKLESLSKNIVGIMDELAKNQGLARLLLYNERNPFSPDLPPVDLNFISKQGSKFCRIFPYPFDPDAQTEKGSFIRVYYPVGEFNENEVIHESEINIDIIVAKDLWLIDDGIRRLIRPYEIMSRIIDMIGKRGLSPIRLKFQGWNHLAVNNEFDAIRMYAKYMTVEL